MGHGNGNRPRWRAGAAMLFIAAIAAVISYNDGLHVARYAGVTGRVAYLYPLLPDGLIVICLIALYEGARMKEPQRPRWASAGLLLGAGLTLAQNVGAGAATGVLLAVIDGFVPVVFFVAAEVLIWTIRQGRPAVTPRVTPWKPDPITKITGDEHCSPKTAQLVQRRERAAVRAFERSRGGQPNPAPAPAARDATAAPSPSAAVVLNGRSHG